MAKTDYDVVVVGSGAAGLCAALTASDAGASVLLVDGQDTLGGSSALSGGIIMAAGTAVQKKAGIDDTPENLFHDYMLFNQYKVDPSLAKRLAYGSGPAVDWLQSLGVEYHDTLAYAAEERFPRSHVPKMMGFGVIDVLTRTTKDRRNIDIALGRRINRLIVKDGRVDGVAVDDDVVTSPAVVIATGGFGANPSMWPEHLPSVSAAGPAAWYIGAPGAQGDAFGLGAQVDAQIVGHDRSLTLPTPDFYTNLEVYFPGWLVMVDRAGNRQVDESTSYAVMQLRHKLYGPLCTVFDNDAKEAFQPGTPPAYKQIFPGMEGLAMPSNWTADIVDQMVGTGKIKKANTLDDLARLLGVSAAGLQATVDRYNGFVDAGEDAQFFKDKKFLKKIQSPPYYGAELRLGILCLTSKGLRIDADAHVLNRAGMPVPGLYAAGECTGGVLGDVYMGSGNSYANCVVFGRTAGETAARESLAAKVAA